MPDITHKQLTIIAKEWLLSAKQCNPVFVEKGSSKTGEMPDAIGWYSSGSIIVECKTSVADFIRDTKKPFRIHPEKGMGSERYYMFAESLYKMIRREKLPEGWGIVTVDNCQRARQVRCKFSKIWTYDIKAELYYLRNRLWQI